MKPRLLLFDLDGTLLDRDRTIRTATLNVLVMAREAGIRVGLATGRSPVSVRRYVEELTPTGPLILLNGCLLWDIEDNRAVAASLLPRRDAVAIARATVQLGIHANFYIGDQLFVANRGRESLDSERKDGVPHTQVDDLVDFVRNHESAPYKVLCIDERGDFRALEASLDTDCTIVRSEPTYLEILPPDVNKGAMLPAIERIYGISPAEIWAFGDQLNDLELLREAGRAIAMGNSNPAVLAAAHHVIGRNDTDAIADFLRSELSLM